MTEQTQKRPVGRPRKHPRVLKGEGLRTAARKAQMETKPQAAYTYPIKPPTLAPNVVPRGTTPPVLAMDANPYSFAMQGGLPGGGFPGFQYLAQLATRPEYRAFASGMSTELTRKWIEFTSKQNDDDDTGEKIKAIEAEFERLNVRGIIQAAAEHDCYFGRGQIFIDIRGADTSTPMVLSPQTIPKGSLNRLSAVEAVWTTPSAYNALDPSAPDFYKPSEWWMLGKQVHASRLMTIITRPLPDILKPAFNFAGMSLSQLAEPYVDNWLRTRQSVADLINNFSITVLSTAMGQILQGGEDDGDGLFKRADLFTAMRANRGLMVLDKETEELGQINTPLSGLHELQAQSQEHMCISAGTLIETARGQIPIEKVEISDKIFTRDGYAPVQWVGVTGDTTQLVEIKTRTSTLRVTRSHPVWSVTKNDFVSAENVNPSHALLKSPGWESMVGQSIGADGSGAKQNWGISGILKRAACSIGYFGKRTSARYQRALMFITKTAIRTITSYQISLCCQERNIRQSMSRKDFCSSSATSLSAFVCNVANGISLFGLRGLNTVLELAKQRLGRPNIQKIESVSIVSLEKSTPVYNIKIEDGYAPEFFANGVLVHNCSVSRMPAIVLTGISPSGLNASSDGEIRVFYDWIAAQQTAFWREPLKTVLDLVQLSLYGEIDPDIEFNFVPLYQMTPEQEAEIRAKDGVTGVGYINAGVLDPSEVREKLAKDPASGYDGLDTTVVLVPPADPEPDAFPPAQDAEFEESKHPRDESGKFGSGGGGGSTESGSGGAKSSFHEAAKSVASASPKWGKTAKANAEIAAQVLKDAGFEARTSNPSGRKTESRFAAFGSPTNGVFINPSSPYWKNPVEMAKANYESGHLSTDNPMGTLLHEVAHTKYGNVQGHWMTSSHKDVASKVSRYAMTNPKEFVSEVFAGVNTGKTYDNDVKQLYEIYTREKI